MQTSSGCAAILSARSSTGTEPPTDRGVATGSACFYCQKLCFQLVDALRTDNDDSELSLVVSIASVFDVPVLLPAALPVAHAEVNSGASELKP